MVTNYTRVGLCLSPETKLQRRDRPRKSQCRPMPALIEGHAHMFLHAYNEATWNDQVTNESYALRVVRATVHAQRTLLAAFTTVRDLGTEGAGYADVGLKQAIDHGIIPGPRLIVVTRALVATGSYGPKLSADLK